MPPTDDLDPVALKAAAAELDVQWGYHDPDGSVATDQAARAIRAYLKALWRPIEEAPKDGTVVEVARYMGEPWGWVRGFARWEKVDGIEGWLARGISDPPGELGLGNPTHFRLLLPAPSND